MTDFAIIVSGSGFVPPKTKPELLAEAATLAMGLRKAAEAIYPQYYHRKPIVKGVERETRIDNLRKMIRKERKRLATL